MSIKAREEQGKGERSIKKIDKIGRDGDISRDWDAPSRLNVEAVLSYYVSIDVTDMKHTIEITLIIVST